MGYIDDLLNENGVFHKQLAHYEIREGQIKLAKRIDEIICNGGVLLAEAGCGSGKTVSYSVPAIMHAVCNKQRTVIVTANIALQEQLASKDLPMLHTVMPVKDWTFQTLKGKSNYFCEEVAFMSQIDGSLLRGARTLTKQVERILKWSKSTPTGDKSDLPFEPDPRVWSRVSVNSDECKKENCSFRGQCFYYAAKQKAWQANIIVTNYHLLFAHLSVKQGSGEDLVLPPYDILIMDEAHEAADIARDFYGFSVSPYSINALKKLTKMTKKPELMLALEDTSSHFFDMCKSTARSSSYKIRLRQEGWDRGASILFRNSLLGYVDFAKALAESPDTDVDLRKEAHAARVHASILAKRLLECVTLQDKNKVYWLDELKHDKWAVKCKSINVSGLIRESVFTPTRAVICTSATITTGNTFAFVKGELGIPPTSAELVVESPFNFQSQGLLVIPQTMVPPDHEAFTRACADELERVIHFCEGKTLALFTSIRNMKAVHNYLKVRDLPYSILMQGEEDGLGRKDLYATFKKDVNSVLLGVASFWTGIDVSGTALTGLVIDKLPFPNVADPLVDAINGILGKQAFMKYSLPRAIITLKQGVGRLIRSRTDFGVVVLLDARLISGKSYASSVLRSLPPFQASTDINAIQPFLQAHQAYQAKAS
jgi:ATP-dependent DNA helicase DinG